jgi:DNA-binding SARP family transcriptional activator/predicted ATPase
VAETLRISLFGNLRICVGDRAVSGLVSRKAEALLAYLAVSGRSHAREKVAELLWSGRSQGSAMANLRVVLTSLRGAIGPYLDVDRFSVGLDPSGDVWVDVATFEALLESGDLAGALALYRGDFLESHYIAGAEGFDDWAIGQRERLRQAAINAYQQITQLLIRREQYEEAFSYAQKLLAMNPLMEAAHRNLMRLYAWTDRRQAALHQYAHCKEILAQELAVEPATATTELYEAILHEVPLPELSTPDRQHNLPTPLTPFVGREEEITDISASLNDARCRLFTLVGLGGSGKSRLAIEVARRQLESFKDGVFNVSLAGLETEQSILPSLAEAMGFHLTGFAEAMPQVINYLRQKKVLLVFDNFEHLLGATGLVASLLEAAPQIKVLTTSRQVLGVHGEHVFRVQGLRFPAEEESVDPSTYDSIKLFVQCVERSKGDFQPTQADLHAIGRISRLVEGMPLALELSASWMSTMSAAAIAQNIERDVSFLAADLEGLATRHRSMRAVLERTWSMLRPTERNALTKLSVFQGGFERQAALQVAEVDDAMLRRLLGSSVVTRHSLGRFSMHELVRIFAGEKLASTPGDREKARDAHAQYFLDFIRGRENDIESGRQQEALKEMKNIRGAYRWAAERPLPWWIRQAFWPVYSIYMFRGWFEEGIAVHTHALNKLEPFRDDPEVEIAQGVIHALLGILSGATRGLDQGQSHIDLSRRLLQGHKAPLERATADVAALYFSNLRYRQRERAIKLCKETLARFRACRCMWGEVVTLNIQGCLCLEGGWIQEALECFEQAYEISRRHDHTFGLAHALDGLGRVAFYKGEYDNARQYFRKSLAENREIDFRYREAEVQNFLADACLAAGSIEEALTNYEGALQIYQKVGISIDACGVQLDLAACLLQMEDREKAARWLQSVYHNLPPGYKPAVDVYHAIVAALWLHRSGYRDIALELASVARNQPDRPKFARLQRVNATLEEICGSAANAHDPDRAAKKRGLWQVLHEGMMAIENAAHLSQIQSER